MIKDPFIDILIDGYINVSRTRLTANGCIYPIERDFVKIPLACFNDPGSNSSNEYIISSDYAKQHNITRARVTQMINEGKLESFRLGSNVYVRNKESQCVE